MTIGALGKISFTVSSTTVKTLRDLSLKHSASLSVHNVHMHGGLVEYTGDDPQQISFKIRLSAYLGATPETDLKILESYITSGTILTFVLGSKTYGRYRWILESYQSSAEQYDKRGNVTQCDVSVTLKEYLKG